MLLALRLPTPPLNSSLSPPCIVCAGSTGSPGQGIRGPGRGPHQGEGAHTSGIFTGQSGGGAIRQAWVRAVATAALSQEVSFWELPLLLVPLLLLLVLPALSLLLLLPWLLSPSKEGAWPSR